MQVIILLFPTLLLLKIEYFVYNSVPLPRDKLEAGGLWSNIILINEMSDKQKFGLFQYMHMLLLNNVTYDISQ